MRVAVEAIRAQRPAAVIAAVPVASREACAMLADVADECVCALKPTSLGGVGAFYANFSQTTDEEVLDLLARHDTCAPSLTSTASLAER